MDAALADRLARTAGLVRLPPGSPGWTRRRRGRGFSYCDTDGRPLDAAARERIGRLAIPPAWTDVWIAPRPDSHVLATGLDDAGRKQYLYHPAWREAADAEKFDRLAGFGSGLGHLRRQVVRDLRGADDTTAGLAALVRLVDLSLIRGGSRCYAEEHGTYGATTLLASHVEVNGSRVELSFPGKGGIDHELVVKDRLLATRLRDLVARADDDSHLFVDDDGRPIERDDVNDYLSRAIGPYTVKDFRTWGATCLVARHLVELASAGNGHDGGERTDAEVRAAIERAAEALGNTPTVCRASYVAPAVVESHHDGTLVRAWRSSRASKWVTRVERATGRVLSSAASATGMADRRAG